jgi:hypothetical protein
MQFEQFKSTYKARNGYTVYTKKSEFTDNYIGIVHITSSGRGKTRSVYNTAVATVAELITNLDPYIEKRNGTI